MRSLYPRGLESTLLRLDRAVLARPQTSKTGEGQAHSEGTRLFPSPSGLERRRIVHRLVGVAALPATALRRVVTPRRGTGGRGRARPDAARIPCSTSGRA